ncbi:MAG: hypothetical protein MJZ58_00215 [Paludibacteraceae bacterium]|nr:hypothetical protein [Paludibacteraceae bacterium]
MKKTLSFVCALLASAMMFAQNMDLPMSKCGQANGGTDWGGVTVSGNTIHFPMAWEGGAGWWIGGEPWTNYNAVVLEIEPVDWKVAINVEYGTATQSNGYEQKIGTPGNGTIRIDLNAAKKSAVQKVYIQSEMMGDVVVKSCTVEGGADPYDISGATEVQPIVGGVENGDYGIKIFQSQLEAMNPNDVVVFRINVLSGEKKLGYGIAKLVAMDDWYNPQEEIGNILDGTGAADYKYLVKDLIKYAKKGGNTWVIGADSQAAGVILNTYDGESELISTKFYSKSGTGLNTVKANQVAVKVFENGQLVIKQGDVRMNVLGTQF